MTAFELIFPPTLDIITTQFVKMAKRPASTEKSISGYIQSVSDVKTSRNNNKYFDGKFQTKDELHRFVVFSPDKHHDKFKSAAQVGKPVIITNATLTPNKAEIEIHVNRKCEIEISPEPLQFKKKLFVEDEEQEDEMKHIKDFKEPFENVRIQYYRGATCIFI